MELRDALRSAIQRLEAADVGSPRLNAETLLMFTLAVDRAYLFAHPERALTSEEQSRYDAALAERARGVPAQYITGHQEFWGLDLIVSPAVLIPRPETEHVVETVLEIARRRPSPDLALRLVDVGTGSGAIALALARELPSAEVHAADISAEALEVARANAARLCLERIHFRQSDALAAFAAEPAFDFVVSNPPYVGENEADKVQAIVKKFEPHVAVFAGTDGLDLIRRLVPEARARLKPEGWLVMEIGYSIGDAVQALVADWSEVRVVPDLQGIPRVVAARH